jgi:hypothetical protein
VGGARGKGLEVALGGANPQDGGDNKEIGSQDEHNGGDDIGSQEEEQASFTRGRISQKKSSITLSLQKFKEKVSLVMITELIKPPRYEAVTKNIHSFIGMA